MDPAQIGDHLRQQHGIFADCKVEIPEEFYDLADCSVAAIKYFLYPGRANSSSCALSQMTELRWHPESGLKISIGVDASIEAARKYVAYKSRISWVDTNEHSTILSKSQIDLNIAMVKKCAAEISLRVA